MAFQIKRQSPLKPGDTLLFKIDKKQFQEVTVVNNRQGRHACKVFDPETSNTTSLIHAENIKTGEVRWVEESSLLAPSFKDSEDETIIQEAIVADWALLPPISPIQEVPQVTVENDENSKPPNNDDTMSDIEMNEPFFGAREDFCHILSASLRSHVTDEEIQAVERHVERCWIFYDNMNIGRHPSDYVFIGWDPVGFDDQLLSANFQKKSRRYQMQQLKFPFKKENTPWCFICGKGENLIACDKCCASRHEKCIAAKEEGKCPQCATGLRIRKESIVWHKLKCFPWWPAQLVVPSLVPQCLKTAPSIHHIAIKYFQENNFSWADRRQMCIFTPAHDPALRSKTVNAKLKAAFQMACETASQQVITETRLNPVDSV